MIKTFTREECKQCIHDCRARLTELTGLNPVVYVIKRIFAHNGVVGYRTWKQTLAVDLNHSDLWASSTREWAQGVIDAYDKESQRWSTKKDTFEIIEVPKEVFKKLPCWDIYKKYECFGGGENG